MEDLVLSDESCDTGALSSFGVGALSSTRYVELGAGFAKSNSALGGDLWLLTSLAVVLGGVVTG